MKICDICLPYGFALKGLVGSKLITEGVTHRNCMQDCKTQLVCYGHLYSQHTSPVWCESSQILYIIFYMLGKGGSCGRCCDAMSSSQAYVVRTLDVQYFSL